jgi:hypothetical protein
MIESEVLYEDYSDVVDDYRLDDGWHKKRKPEIARDEQVF